MNTGSMLKTSKKFRLTFGIFLAVPLVLIIWAWLSFKYWVEDHIEPHSIPGIYAVEPLELYLNEPQSKPPVTSTEISGVTDTFDPDEMLSPPRAYTPWLYWSLPAGKLDVQQLTEHIDQYDQAGYGGFILGLNKGRSADEESEAISIDTPYTWHLLRTTIRAAAERDLEVDLNIFIGGNPIGGPHIPFERSLKNLTYSELNVTGGRKLVVRLPEPEPGLSDYTNLLLEWNLDEDVGNFVLGSKQLVAVVATPKISGKRSRSPLDLDDIVELEADEVIVLTDFVSNGVLEWQAPEGPWVVVAVYMMPSGEVGHGSGYDPPGFAADLLDADTVRSYMNFVFGERSGLPALYGKGLRGINFGNLEIKLSRLTSTDILEQFRQRRGYDLTPYLPVVFRDGIDNSWLWGPFNLRAQPDFSMTDADERIRYDYGKTISDLFIERTMETSVMWADERGLLITSQRSSVTSDLIRAMGISHIPETEQLYAGGSEYYLKLGSSAANLYGSRMVSNESFDWFSRENTVTPRRMKATANKNFLSGINHIYAYTGKYVPRKTDPGREFVSKDIVTFSMDASPSNVFWPDIPRVNSYIARSQYLLRQGAPSVDVLIYYPFLGFPSYFGLTPEKQDWEPLFEGYMPDTDFPFEPQTFLPFQDALPKSQTDPRIVWLRKLRAVTDTLNHQGLTWAWVNGHALTSGLVEPGRLPKSKGTYQAILLPNINALPVEDLQSIIELGESEVPVFFYGQLPREQRTFRDRAAGDQRIRTLTRSAVDNGTAAFIESPDQLINVLDDEVVSPIGQTQPSSIRRISRSLGEGRQIHFFANETDKSDRISFFLGPDHRPAWWFDADHRFILDLPDTAYGTVDLELGAYDSRFLLIGLPKPTEKTREPCHNPAGAVATAGITDWILTPSPDAEPLELNELIDWQYEEATRYAEGPGLYKAHFTTDTLPENSCTIIDLGLVHGVADVRVNGENAGRAVTPPFTVDITDHINVGRNEVAITLIPAQRNAFIGRALKGEKDLAYLRKRRHQLVATGLLGPVSIDTYTPLSENTGGDPAILH